MTDTLIDDKAADAGIPLIEKAGTYLFRYAILLNRSVEEIANLSVIPFVEEWIGVPYSFGGNSKEGIDCSGFVQQLVSCLHNISLSRMVKTQFEECRSLLREELREGDLLFFHTTRPGLSHVGYYLGNNKFVHASTARGVIIDDLCDPYYDKAFRFGGRLFDRNEAVSASAND
jgi:lipoprotein Spr